MVIFSLSISVKESFNFWYATVLSLLLFHELSSSPFNFNVLPAFISNGRDSDPPAPSPSDCLINFNIALLIISSAIWHHEQSQHDQVFWS